LSNRSTVNRSVPIIPVVLLLLALMASAHGGGFAREAMPGALKGTVLDAACGKPLAGAHVMLVVPSALSSDEETAGIAALADGGRHFRNSPHAVTDQKGCFEMPSIPCGASSRWSLIAWAGTYDTLVVRKVEIFPGAGQAALAEVRLNPGNAAVTFIDELPPTAKDLVPRRPASPMDTEERRSRGSHLIFATREGLVGGTTANGHIIVERDHFVALPSRKNLCPDDSHRTYEVELTYGGRTARAPVWDVGPWNVKDDYWNPPSLREMWNDLAQFMPEAQAAFVDNYNNGKDGYGRTVKNPAGIDLGDGVYLDDLAMRNNDWIEVRYLWQEGSLPGDIDLDGRLTSNDADLCLKISIGLAISYDAQPALHQATSDERAAADINGDGQAGADDAVLILHSSVE
jgi:hypothetical protein